MCPYASSILCPDIRPCPERMEVFCYLHEFHHKVHKCQLKDSKINIIVHFLLHFILSESPDEREVGRCLKHNP
jgi:hypothetical protein